MFFFFFFTRALCYNMFEALLVLALEGQSLNSLNMLLTIHNAGPSCLARSIRTVYKNRKYSFSTCHLITSLIDLLQANHQCRIDTSKTKSTGSPVLSALIASQILLFRTRRIIFPSLPGTCSQANKDNFLGVLFM